MRSIFRVGAGASTPTRNLFAQLTRFRPPHKGEVKKERSVSLTLHRAPAIPRASENTEAPHGQDQSRQPGRRARRRRDDPHHLGPHQGEADPALSRHRARILRPRHRAPRRDRRPGHGRRGARHQEARRRRQMRHHHAGRSAREGVQAQGDVEVAQRHDPQHPGRRDLPRADHLQERAAPGARLDASPSSSAATPSATSTARPISASPARAR